MHRRLISVLALVALPSLALAQVPHRGDVVARLARAHPTAFACAHTPAACGWDFIRLVACELHADDARFGLNGKRGNPNDLSWDALNYCDVTGPATDPTGQCTRRVTVIDVIGSAGSPAATPIWLPFADDPTPGAWVRPTGCGAPPPAPPPSPPPIPAPAPPDTTVLARLEALQAQLAALTATVGELRTELQRTASQENVAAVFGALERFTARWNNYQDRLVTHGLQVRIGGFFGGSGAAKLPAPPPEPEP